MKEEYYVTVRNNPLNPATLIENTVFAIDLLLFGTFCILSFLDKEYIPSLFFFALAATGLFLLYQNNAPLAHATKRKVTIRKYFKNYIFKWSDLKSTSISSGKTNINFCGKNFSIPSHYLGAKLFIRLLRIKNSPFATEEGVSALKQYIQEHACKSALLLKPKPDTVPSLTSSKIGGIPYWPSAKEYPRDEEGKKMHLLCQLNLSECKDSCGLLPQSGILQFFISPAGGDVYGMNWDRPTEQKNWRIVFHEQTEESLSEDQIKEIAAPESEYPESPILKSIALEFSPSTSYIKSDDYKMDQLVKDAAKKITGKDFEGSIYDLLGPDEINTPASQVYDMLEETENYMLGYPSFVQYDVRSYMPKEEAAYFDTLLLHLDSLSADGKIMCWGDMGCANFLMNSEALKRCDFSKVFYTWDCT
ncbi:MAG: DUF1963 domain-containing protein [Treponema sp.]|nr:DUF1963 domain-containing protein [Treponema sp.]